VLTSNAEPESPREWAASEYDDLRLPHQAWGRQLVNRLQLKGSERVLDAGCGTGRDTALLRRRWPGVRVVAVDASHQMLERARLRLAGDPHVELVHADLARPLPLTSNVDAVVSVAAFHWIRDHEALFGNLHHVMRPGATLTAECGGRGNLSAVNAAVARVIGEEIQDWEFPSAAETRRRLAGCGFDDLQIRLRPDTFRVENPEILHRYLATVVLGSHLDRLPATEHHQFLTQVAEALAEPVIDYVRLEITAVRM
jgi:trans-aconitate 2-methyltransferase